MEPERRNSQRTSEIRPASQQPQSTRVSRNSCVLNANDFHPDQAVTSFGCKVELPLLLEYNNIPLSLVSEDRYILCYIHSLLRSDYMTRDNVAEVQITQENTRSSANMRTQIDGVSAHPQEFLLHVLESCSQDLRQKLFRKLLMCRLAIPVVVPHPEGLKIYDASMQSLGLTWYAPDGVPVHTNALESPNCPVVTFCRVGDCHNLSKSMLLNEILSATSHPVYFTNATLTKPMLRDMSSGSIESAFYLPSRTGAGIFEHSVNFLNLRGNSYELPNQMRILQFISSVFVVILESGAICSDGVHDFLASLGTNIYTVVLFDVDHKIVPQDKLNLSRRKLTSATMANKKNYKFLRTYDKFNNQKNIPKIREEVLNAIRCGLEVSVSEGHLTDSCNQGGIRLESDFYRDISEPVKEILQNSTVVKIRKMLKFQKSKRQLKDLDSLPSLITHFIHILDSPKCALYGLTFIQQILHEICSKESDLIVEQYKTEWKGLQVLKENPEENKEASVVKRRQLNKTVKNIVKTSVDTSSLFRELVSMIYLIHTHDADTTERHPIQDSLDRLPETMASLVSNGLQLEIVHNNLCPIAWIESVLKSLDAQLSSPNVTSVGILGAQGSGKSTLINSLFGLDLITGEARCLPRGFIQVVSGQSGVKAKKKRPEWFMVFDTERFDPATGVTSSDNDDVTKMNTITMIISDVIIVNIMGESYTEVVDAIIAALQLMFSKSIITTNQTHHKQLVLVHQNISAANAPEALSLGHMKIIQQLDNAVHELAIKYHITNVNSLHDVMSYDLQDGVFYLPGYWDGESAMAFVNRYYVEKAERVLKYIVRLGPIHDKHRNFTSISSTLKMIENKIL